MQRMTYLQTLSLASVSYLPLAYWIFPGVAVKYAHLDALWAMLGVIGASLVMAWGHQWINNRLPDVGGFDIVVRVCGRGIATMIGVVYVPCYLLFVALCCYFFASMMKAYFPATPRFVFLMTFVLLSWRGAWGGIENLGRVASIVFPMTLVGNLTSCIAVMIRGEYRWIPTQVVSLQDTWLGVLHLLPLYLGFNIFLMLNPYYYNSRLSKWYCYISVVIAGVAMLTSFFAVLSNLGWFAPEHLTFPMQFTLGLLHLRGFLIERIGIVIIILATAYTVLFTSNHIWCQATLIARILGQPEDDYRRFSVLVVAIIVGMAMAVRNGADALWLYNHVLVPISWCLLLGVPLLLVALMLIRRIQYTCE